MKKIYYFIPFGLILLLTILRYAHLQSKDPAFLSCKKRDEQNVLLNNQYLQRFKDFVIGNVEKNLPGPHSDLVLGMVLGVDKLDKTPKFYQDLRTTGTIHVVVVSGFNINLVFNFVFKLLGGSYKKSNLIIGILITLVYSVVSGFEPPVVRAWIMGCVLVIGKYYGRSMEVILVLLFSASVMIIINPCYIKSLSFQLSFLATLGLILFSEKVSGLCSKIIKTNNHFTEDLSATVSAQLLVTPLLMNRFGEFSIYSVLINALILWTVPLITILGSMSILIGLVGGIIGRIAYLPAFILSDIFILFVNVFSKLPYATISLSVSNSLLLTYYLIIIIYVILSYIGHK